ncbi:uncharacterized protein F4822DRAFT_423916 [Hypoxylon trugodes]|uniref:uncharacterized protein n=1 Tax=Hypoxylon trugodes TaxID=326681 RepID=UPI00219B2619|nr:uncharacterized protein F4822DRAFT_423916 [Hypoxylon trugodes]KAI1393447.1 hypothetical protein F4822DRAFT_423916 [Hypoxylon trugodes]
MRACLATTFFLFLAHCRADFDITTNLTADTIPNGTQLVGYVQDPDGRGTTTLVISCLLTLVLCVWSALHLNVPRRQQSRIQNFWLNLRWVVAEIYAPELAVFTAWRQWCSARLLQQLVEQSLEDPKPSSLATKCSEQWTMSHSFFACTGGFAFELAPLESELLNPDDLIVDRPRRLTLTARGVALLARCGHLPSIRREEIEDKSKANDLAKATVIIQAVWMLIQVVGRLASKLPVTPLEVNTVAHVLCAFMMYLFWWNKPLLPNEPIILDADELGPLAAFMYSSSEMSGYVNPQQVKSQTIIKTLFAHLNLYSKAPEFETICLQPTTPEAGVKPYALSTSTPLDSNPDIELLPFLQDPKTSFSRAPQICISELQARREKEQGTAFFERRPRIISERADSTQPSMGDTIRWTLIKEALQSFPILCDDLDHVQNWPSNDLLRNVDSLVVGMVLWLANLCYGGIHAVGWNEHFPTTAESWLWRASALYIGFCGGLWVALNLMVAKIPTLNEFWEHWMDGKKTWWQNLGLGIVVFLCGFSLVLARMFIVVEAIISIRELPAAAYQTPEWTDLFPHF